MFSVRLRLVDTLDPHQRRFAFSHSFPLTCDCVGENHGANNHCLFGAAIRGSRKRNCGCFGSNMRDFGRQRPISNALRSRRRDHDVTLRGWRRHVRRTCDEHGRGPLTARNIASTAPASWSPPAPARSSPASWSPPAPARSSPPPKPEIAGIVLPCRPPTEC
jgi:hypothetical protein